VGIRLRRRQPAVLRHRRMDRGAGPGVPFPPAAGHLRLGRTVRPDPQAQPGGPGGLAAGV